MINGHIEIADKVYVTAGTLVSNTIAEAGRYTGYYPVMRHGEWERSAALVRNLGSMRDRVRALERTVRPMDDDEK
jgi:UDP-3-O-[3-hydroxymyristoyl] glucosamine N-acyltransferase